MPVLRTEVGRPQRTTSVNRSSPRGEEAVLGCGGPSLRRHSGLLDVRRPRCATSSPPELGESRLGRRDKSANHTSTLNPLRPSFFDRSKRMDSDLHRNDDALDVLCPHHATYVCRPPPCDEKAALGCSDPRKRWDDARVLFCAILYGRVLNPPNLPALRFSSGRFGTCPYAPRQRLAPCARRAAAL